MKRSTRVGVLAAGIALIVLVAVFVYRRGRPLSYVPASGRIVFADNSPVGEIRLLFFPRDQSGEPFPTVPYCLVGKDGRFEVLMGATKPGIPPGRYGVVILPFTPKTLKHSLPAGASDPAATPVEVVIPAGGSSDLLIRVEH